MKHFDDLYSKYYESVYRFAFHFLRNYENASDISQDVFTELYGSILRRNEIRNVKSWLFKVTSNLCLSYLKRNNKIGEYKTTKQFEDEQEVPENSMVLEALQRLEEKDQMLLTLYNEGLSYKELAEITGIKYTSVGKTLSRTLKRLKNEMEKK